MPFLNPDAVNRHQSHQEALDIIDAALETRVPGLYLFSHDVDTMIVTISPERRAEMIFVQLPYVCNYEFLYHLYTVNLWAVSKGDIWQPCIYIRI